MRGFLGCLIVSVLLVLPGGASGGVLDLDFVELLKGVDRSNGTISEFDPYFIEICAEGVGLTSATVTPPGQSPMAIPLPECLEFSYDTLAELNVNFPSAGESYQFSFNGGADGIAVMYGAPAPQGFPAVVSPPHMATNVDPDANLVVSWSVDTSGCGGVLANCGDGIQLFLIDSLADIDILEIELDITATMAIVQAADLNPGTGYQLELETYNGDLELDTTTTGGDPVSVTAIFEDINSTQFTTLPEPGPSALGVAALAMVSLIGGRRRGRR